MINQNQTHYRDIFYNKYASTRSLLKTGSADLSANLAARKPFLLSIIKKFFPKNRDAKIIDVGCGYGALLYFSKQAGYQNWVGYDASEEQVSVANQMGLEQVYLKTAMDALNLLADHSIDLVISFDIVEHMTKLEVIAFSREVFRVLKPRGKWIIHTLNAESPFFGRIRYGDFTHENGFTKESIKQLLNVVGYQQVHCYEDVPIAHGIKSALRLLFWKLIRSIYRFCLAAETGEKNGIFSQNFLVVAERDE